MAYYDPKGPPTEALEQCKRTRHAWAFKTNVMEQRSLELVRDGVRRQTEYDKIGATEAVAAKGMVEPRQPVISVETNVSSRRDEGVASMKGPGSRPQQLSGGPPSAARGDRKRNHGEQAMAMNEAVGSCNETADNQAAMLKMIGLTGIRPGQKITIAPRKD